VSFDDIAQRMKQRRGLTRGERLQQFWTGEEPEIRVEEPVAPVAPAARTKTLVAAYALMLLGILVMLAGAVPLVFVWDSASWLEFRGLCAVVVIGIAVLARSVRLFIAADATEPLPDARLRQPNQ
jgi:hypothetical protein